MKSKNFSEKIVLFGVILLIILIGFTAAEMTFKFLTETDFLRH